VCIRSAKPPILSHQRGVAAIETALILPLLFLLGFGGMELANYLLVHSRLSQIALGLADNASRIGGTTGQVHIRDIQEIFVGAEYQSNGMDWKNNGRMILSSLEVRKDTADKKDKQKIHWQRCFGGLAHPSSYGDQGEYLGEADAEDGGMGPDGNKIKATAGTAVMFVELAYNYNPIVMPDLIGEQKITYTAAFNVREARDLDANDKMGIIHPESVKTPKIVPCTAKSS
jgi:hypothetical protein